MNSEEYFLQEFNSEFKDGIDNYALVGEAEAGYSIIDVTRESMMVIEKKEIADFFIKRLLEMNVKIYRDTKEIPGWGTKERERSPDIYTLLKEQSSKK